MAPEQDFSRLTPGQGTFAVLTIVGEGWCRFDGCLRVSGLFHCRLKKKGVVRGVVVEDEAGDQPRPCRDSLFCIAIFICV